jgi:Icc-related predicted phosphoesterase
MKFVYTTDLHGDENKYKLALDLAIRSRASVLHIGADILPKGYSMQPRQKEFIKMFLPKFINSCKNNNIKFIAMFGNDDLWTRKPLYRNVCGDLIDEKPVEVDEFTFTGYPYVPDYPFGLKTACKYDYMGWVPEPYISPPVEITEDGIVPIVDVIDYFEKKGTIEDDLLNREVVPNEIIAIHTPPRNSCLDTCIDGRIVGSKSVGEWIKRTQPYMVLCGHIHECPWTFRGCSSSRIDRTWIIQPGQYLSGASFNPKEEKPQINIKQNPWADTSRLRASIITTIPGKEPNIEICDISH